MRRRNFLCARAHEDAPYGDAFMPFGRKEEAPYGDTFMSFYDSIITKAVEFVLRNA